MAKSFVSNTADSITSGVQFGVFFGAVNGALLIGGAAVKRVAGVRDYVAVPAPEAAVGFVDKIPAPVGKTVVVTAAVATVAAAGYYAYKRFVKPAQNKEAAPAKESADKAAESTEAKAA